MTAQTAKVWLLMGERLGDNSQARALARHLGVDAEEKDLRFNGLYRLPNVVKGASLRSLDKDRSSALEPPWPDMVIATGRRSVAVARWIRRQADTRVRLIQIGRPQAAPKLFDLVLTTPQYRLAAADNIIKLALPFTLLDNDSLEPAGRQWRKSVEGLPRPLVAVAIGGDTSTCRFGRADAENLARLAGEYAGARGGTLVVSTSARTSRVAVAALKASLPAGAKLFVWDVEADNPYLGYLALADEIIVTGDSASMIADAAATGKPLSIYPVPFDARNRVIGFQDRLLGRYEGGGSGRRVLGPLVRGLVKHGWISAPRRMDRLVDALLDTGRAGVLGEKAAPRKPLPGSAGGGETPLDVALRRIRGMLEN